MSKGQKMRETVTSKTILATAAIALLALAFVPASAFASSAPPVGFTLNMSGVVGTSPINVLGYFNIQLAGAADMPAKGSLVQGTTYGIYTDQNNVAYTVYGGWSYNTATGKALMKLVEVNGAFTMNLAFLNLPSSGFTFQGIIHMTGQGPVMLAAPSGSGPVWIYS